MDAIRRIASEGMESSHVDIQGFYWNSAFQNHTRINLGLNLTGKPIDVSNEGELWILILFR